MSNDTITYCTDGCCTVKRADEIIFNAQSGVKNSDDASAMKDTASVNDDETEGDDAKKPVVNGAEETAAAADSLKTDTADSLKTDTEDETQSDQQGTSEEDKQSKRSKKEGKHTFYLLSERDYVCCRKPVYLICVT